MKHEERPQCQAKIRDPYTVPDRIKRVHPSDLPVSAQCSRESDGPVCGVQLCWHHRNLVVQITPAGEQLAPGTVRRFERWGVTPSGPFTPLDG